MNTAIKQPEITEEFARALIVNRVTPQYKVVTYVPLEVDETDTTELMTWDEAINLIHDLKILEPDNIFQVRVEAPNGN